MEIDKTSKGVVERLRGSIDYSAVLTPVELAHYLAEIVLAWSATCPLTEDDIRVHRVRAFLALEHAAEVLDAVYPAE